MNKGILARLLISLIVIGWAFISLFPIKDRPFAEVLLQKATADKSEFGQLMETAKKKVASKESPSLFLALNELADKNNVDLSKFFPSINLADIKNVTKKNEILLKYLLQQSQGKIKLGLDLRGGVSFTLKINEEAFTKQKDTFYREQQLSKAISIIEKRINGLGVAEPLIRARGNSQIEVQLPGISTQENPHALASLQKPAKLTFHKVHRTLYPKSTPTSEQPAGFVPMDLEITDPHSGQIHFSQLFIKKIPEMTGAMVKEAFVSQSQYGAYEIGLHLTDSGAKRFEEITKSIVDENNEPPFSNMEEANPAKKGRLAIVLDGKLYSAPRVNDVIGGGRAVITGDFTQREALELANVLNNPLEFELKLEEMNEVGPSLADDARLAAIRSTIVGSALVVLFMVGYYLSAGIIAVIALVANIIIILGVQAGIQSTLTFPGVAALVLTIGMAVDANILIYERIREEMKTGKNLKSALLAGFHKAFATILDANLTTLLAGVILIYLGTGAIKGFGVTLSIGIGATMFCSLILSRALLELCVNKNLIKNPFRFSIFKESNIDFMKYGKPAFILTWVIVFAGFVGLYFQRNHIYSIDFTGGDEISIKYQQKLPLQDIYNTASKYHLGEVLPSYQTNVTGTTTGEILKIQTELQKGRLVFDALSQSFPQSGLEIVGENTIGASVSNSLKLNALLSIATAILGIMIYVAFRFEFGFGIGAIVSTVHDILMSIGIYVLLGGQFSAPMVAAILMIIGYSINDTIVVFDRIREELSLNATASLKTIINISINKTLSRTILTSLTTLLAALALYLFGAGIVKDFSLVFIIGIVTGTFSSIFVASPIFYWWHRGDRKHIEQKKLSGNKEQIRSPIR